MNLLPERPRSTGSLLASVAIHLAIVLVMAQMIFRYPIGILLGGFSSERHITPEDIHFVRVSPPPPASSSAPTTRASKPAPRGGAPAPLIAPTTIPTAVVPPLPKVQAPAEAAGGTGNGLGVTGGAGVATGVIPALPDKRIRVSAPYFEAPVKTPAEKIDSIVNELYGVMLDSAEAAGHQRKPGDWTVTTKDGKKYGWDQQGIQLGKFMIPNALFALLPLKIQANPTLNSRYTDQLRADVLFQGRLSITEDEFRAAVKRIRERNEKIHEEHVKAREKADSSSH
ncbi:MAG: hypothetical protein ACYCVL_07060 [Gemmatimonadaceae bacterium]